MTSVVIGGTGLIGSKTVAFLRQGGTNVFAASPNTGVNTIIGEGRPRARRTEVPFIRVNSVIEEHEEGPVA